MKRVVLSLLCILSLLITSISGKAEGIVNYWPNTFTQSSDGKVTVSPNTYSYEYFDVETFMMKKGVTSYEVQPGNTGFSSKDGVLYSVDGKKLLAYPGESTATTFTVPEGVETIGWGAFSGAKYLQKIVMASTVKEQRPYAFTECKALTSVVNNKKLRYVYEGAYKNCSNLTVSFPTGLEILEGTAMVGVKKYNTPVSVLFQQQDYNAVGNGWIIGQNKSKMPSPNVKKVKTKSSVVKGTGKATTKWYKKGKKKYYISSPDQLAGLADLVAKGISFKDKTIYLTKDLDLRKYSNWETIGFAYYDSQTELKFTKMSKAFRGTFNGNNKTIYNLKIHEQQNMCVGLFGAIGASGVVKNLNVKAGSVLGYAFVGGIAGISYGTIDKCSFGGRVSGRQYVGGIVGSTNLAGAYDSKTDKKQIKNCTNKGHIFAYSYAGGIAGMANKISKCTNKGIVEGYHDINGVSGKYLMGINPLTTKWISNKNKGKVKRLV